jgi:hypothetical protein
MSDTTSIPDPYTDGSVPEDADLSAPADDQAEQSDEGDDASPAIPPLS